MTRRRGAAALLVLVTLVLGGCGVPTEEHPQVVERTEVPFGLARDHAPPSTRP